MLKILLCVSSAVVHLFYSPPAYAERSCSVIVKEVSAVFGPPLGCMRRNCPRLSILDFGAAQAERCAKNCNLAWDRPDPTGSPEDLKRCEHFVLKIEGVAPDHYGHALCLAASESDLSRCSDSFRTSDERDYYKLARCLRASEAIALLVEPLHTCTNRDECLKGDRDWQRGSCFEQCHQEAEQLVEIATTTVERCDGIEQSRKSLCSTLRRAISVCFLPEHCDRLKNTLLKSCS